MVAISTMFVADIASATSLTQTKTGTFTFTAFNTTSQSVSVIGNSGVTEAFNPFNSALGTLQSVDVSWIVDASADLTVGANTGGSVLFGPGGTFFVGSAAYDGTGFGISNGGGPGSVISQSGHGSSNHNFIIPNKSNYDPSISNAFTGGNSFNLNWGTGRQNLSVNNIAKGTFNFSHTASVTYNYLAASVPTPPVAPIPEPETYAMMLAGLGALGFMARRRKSL